MLCFSSGWSKKRRKPACPILAMVYLLPVLDVGTDVRMSVTYFSGLNIWWGSLLCVTIIWLSFHFLVLNETFKLAPTPQALLIFLPGFTWAICDVKKKQVSNQVPRLKVAPEEDRPTPLEIVKKGKEVELFDNLIDRVLLLMVPVKYALFGFVDSPWFLQPIIWLILEIMVSFISVIVGPILLILSSLKQSVLCFSNGKVQSVDSKDPEFEYSKINGYIIAITESIFESFPQLVLQTGLFMYGVGPNDTFYASAAVSSLCILKSAVLFCWHYKNLKNFFKKEAERIRSQYEVEKFRKYAVEHNDRNERERNRATLGFEIKWTV